MSLSSIFPKLLIGVAAGGTIGGITYFGVRNSSSTMDKKIEENFQDREEIKPLVAISEEKDASEERVESNVLEEDAPQEFLNVEDNPTPIEERLESDSDSEDLEKSSQDFQEDEEEDAYLEIPPKEEKVLAEYVLVNGDSINCERLLKDVHDADIECNNSWAQELLKDLGVEQGWVLKGENEIIKKVVEDWKWSKESLESNSVKNPWIVGDANRNFSLSNECSTNPIEGKEGESKVICKENKFKE